MPGPKDVTHVDIVQQRSDNTLVVHVLTDNFTPGQEVEVSVYLTQGEAYAAHNEKKHIPFADSKQPTALQVELPATELDPNQPVTVLTRVAEVWPSVLEQDPQEIGAAEEYPDQGLKAVWRYPDSEGN